MTTITRTTIARKAREFAADEYHYHQWSHGGNNPMSHTECREIGYRKAWDELLPTFGWPGGYAMEYILPSGETLCAECAREHLRQNKTLYADLGEEFPVYRDSTDGYDGDDSADHLYCDDCGKEICRAWLREPGHPDDRDLPWSLVRRLRAEDAGVPLGARRRYQPRDWRGTRRDRRYARRYARRYGLHAAWRDMTPADVEYCA